MSSRLGLIGSIWLLSWWKWSIYEPQEQELKRIWLTIMAHSSGSPEPIGPTEPRSTANHLAPRRSPCKRTRRSFRSSSKSRFNWALDSLGSTC